MKRGLVLGLGACMLWAAWTAGAPGQPPTSAPASARSTVPPSRLSQIVASDEMRVLLSGTDHYPRAARELDGQQRV
jgi:hypothetical protein